MLTVITGGAGGIGLATAQTLLADAADARVAIVDREPVDSRELSAYAGRWHSFVCDVTQKEAVDQCAEEVRAHLGPIRRLVACAGNVHNGASADIRLEDFHRVLAVHLDGTVLWCQAVYADMAAARDGAIVNVGSVAGLFGHPRRLAYGAAKAAIHSVTKTLAVEWATAGIRVNAVAPGYVATPLMKEVTRLGLADAALASSWAAMKRMADPREVAGMIAFLLSERASFVTGSIVTVDGGFSAMKTEVAVENAAERG